MVNISQILTEHRTDKNGCVRGKHCYGKVYDVLFKPFNRRSKLDIFEVGVERGWSLIAWREYFPKARIEGLDISDEKIETRSSDIDYIIGDIREYEPKKKYDIVIDDGSHKLDEVLCTVDKFKLKVGGIMVIEDCQNPHLWLRKIKNHTRYSIEAIDLRRLYHQRDNFLIVLRNYGYKV